jgi:hypothetical protein
MDWYGPKRKIERAGAWPDLPGIPTANDHSIPLCKIRMDAAVLQPI